MGDIHYPALFPSDIHNNAKDITTAATTNNNNNYNNNTSTSTIEQQQEQDQLKQNYTELAKTLLGRTYPEVKYVFAIPVYILHQVSFT